MVIREWKPADRIPVTNIKLSGHDESEKDNRVFIFLLDYAKAFAVVCRRFLKHRLKESGIPRKVIRLIDKIYKHTQSRCRVGKHHTKIYFKTTEGTAQGCNFSPCLFVIFIDPLLREVEKIASSAVVAKTAKALYAFADDFACVAIGAENIQNCINKCKEMSDKLGMKANVLKSAVMCLGYCTEADIGCTFKWGKADLDCSFAWNSTDLTCTFDWGDRKLPFKSKYDYLGLTITPDCNWDTQISKSKGVALKLFASF